LVPLFRAIVVWAVILVSVVLPRLTPPVQAVPAVAAVTQLSAYDRLSVVRETRSQRVQAAEMAQAQAWSAELTQGLADYQAQQQALAAAQAQADQVDARSKHDAPPQYIDQIIADAFNPLGPAAVQWALNVAYCESRYHPTSVTSTSVASGLFQLLPSTWPGTTCVSKYQLDPVGKAQSAAWLFCYDGPLRCPCHG